ncbi:MAG TPA: glycosyltransferase family 2 protein [Chthoniobacterales bacterium]|jgi:undecaprenyl-phosphate 4-deoxy-4-formamido-L-arabinose transferase|nr:glycosyltransferase family 2 protein [Chthoniobacterales bacterium]
MDEFQPHLSIVVPLYNAAATLPALHAQIAALQVPGGHELIVVNDGSRDETEAVALKLTRESALPMTLLNLSRNFGEHNAVLAGLRAVSGRYVVTMDDDLQNPPSEALKLLAVAEAEKRDVVFAIYEHKEHAWWRNAGSWLTNRIADFVVDKPRRLYLSSFRCLSRFVADEVAKSRTPYPYIDGLIFQVTQNAGTVRVRHAERPNGASGYNLHKLLRLWMSMLINVSVVPLRLMTFAGLFTSALGFLAVVEVVLEHVLHHTPTGWSSLMAAMLLLSGTQLLLLGILGEYVGRIYLGISEKPQSVVRERVSSPGGDGLRV